LGNGIIDNGEHLMSNVNANVNILVNTTQATAQIRVLQGQINSLNATMASSGGSAMAAKQIAMNKAMSDAAVASGMFTSKVVPMTHSIDGFSKKLDKGQLSMGQYTKGVMSQVPGMSRMFQKEFTQMTRVAETRVKALQTQYTALGNSGKAMALTPTALDMKNMGTQAAIAAQRTMLMNKMITDGSTKLLNYGKNLQWAGRQLMVGFTLPLVAFGAVAAKTFMDLEKQTRDFKRVYGDAFTPPQEIEKNLEAIKKLGDEYTKYGVKVSETMEIAATAAAAGMRNDKLLYGTEQSLRLATVGQIDYNQALETTITLQTAFKTSAQELPEIVDFIGAVANQTVLTVDDMTKAIPRVAPVVAGLGGDVKDLAALLTAMREGGVSAEQGANAIKSGLARMINPTKAAKEALSGMGISIDAIVQGNAGDFMGTINDLSEALKGLGDFERQQALEKLFGKYQYARLGALFENITREGSQAATTLDLAGQSAEQLGQLSAKSMKEIEESTTAKFQGAVEKMKMAIAPVGEAFLKALTPIIGFVTKIAQKFNELPDTFKDVLGTLVVGIGVVAPVVLMLVGLFGNLIANGIKVLQGIRRLFASINGGASAFSHLTMEELEASAAATSLEGSSSRLTKTLLMQESAVNTLISLYSRLAASATTAASSMASASSMVAGASAMRAGSLVSQASGSKSMVSRSNVKGFAKGGTVPGSGNKDTVPALLTPGESVVTKKATQSYAPFISAMNSGTLSKFATGITNLGGISVPTPVAQYNIRSGSIAPVQQIIEDARQIDGALDQVTAILRQFAQTGALISKSALTQALAAQGVNLSQNRPPTLSAAHLTAVKKYGDLSESRKAETSRYLETKGATGQNMSSFIRSNPALANEHVKVYSGLTAGISQTLNGLLKTGAPVQTFMAEWSREGSRILPALQKFGGLVNVNNKDLDALARFERELGTKVSNLASEMGDNVVNDVRLDQSVKELTAKYINASGAMGRVAQAAAMAANAIGGVGVSMPRATAERMSNITQNGREQRYIDRSSGAVLGRYSPESNKWRPERVQSFANPGDAPRQTGSLSASSTTRPQSSSSIISQSAETGTQAARAFTEKWAATTKASAPIVTSAAASVGTLFATQLDRSMAAYISSSPEANAAMIKSIITGGEMAIPAAKERGTLTGKAYSDAIKASIMSGGAIPMPNMSVAPQSGTKNMLNAPSRTPTPSLPGSNTPMQNNKPSSSPVQAIKTAGASMRATTQALSGAFTAAGIGIVNTEKGLEKISTGVGKWSNKFKAIGARTREAYLANKAAQEKNLNKIEKDYQAVRPAAAPMNRAERRAAAKIDQKNTTGQFKNPIGSAASKNMAGVYTAQSQSAAKELNSVTGKIKNALSSFRVGIQKGNADNKMAYGSSTKTILSGAKEVSLALISGGKSAGSAIVQASIPLKNSLLSLSDSIRMDAAKIGSGLAKAGGDIAKGTTRVSSALMGLASKIANSKIGTGLSNVGGSANGAVMGLMGISMAASMAGGEIGEMAQKIMPITMGLMGLQMVMPMFKSKLGLATIAVAAIAAVFVKGRVDMDNLAKSAAKAGASLGNIPNQMDIISEATGFKFPDQKDMLFRFTKKDSAAMEQFSSFFESEKGSKFIQELKSASSTERYEKVANMLKQAIDSGLDPEKAKAFGMSLAQATGDYIMNSRLLRDFANGNMRGNGAQGLIDSEKNRLKLQPGSPEGFQMAGPNMPFVGGGQNQISARQGVGMGVGTAIGMTAGSVAAGAIAAATASAATAATGAAVGAAVGSVVPILGTAIGAIVGLGAGYLVSKWFTSGDQDALNKQMEQSARGLGFALQTAQNLANIEAVIQDQREKGITSYQEYATQMAEVNAMQADQSTYISSIFANAADSGAMMQALKDQLSLKGLSESQQEVVSKRLDPNALAQNYFQKDFKDLVKGQQDYLGAVFEQVMSGLSPDNVEQRMSDVEGSWKTVAEKYIEAIEAGIDPKTLFEKVNLGNWADTLFNDGTVSEVNAVDSKKAEMLSKARTGQKQTLEDLQKQRDDLEFTMSNPNASELTKEYDQIELDKLDNKIKETKENLASLSIEIDGLSVNTKELIVNNIDKMADEINETFGVTKEQITSVASGFKDSGFITDLLKTEDGVKTLAENISKLKDFKDIDIELMMKNKADVDEVVVALNEIKEFKFKKDGSNDIGKMLPNKQIFANLMIDAGKSAEELPKIYKKAANKTDDVLDGIGENVLTKLGTIKPKILPDVILQLFGDSLGSAEDIASRLNAAFPEGLSPIDLQILVGIGGPGAAFLTDPKFIEAMKNDEDFSETTQYLGSTRSTIRTDYTPQQIALYKSLKADEAGTVPGVTTTGDDENDGGAGGEKEKTWLEGMIEGFVANNSLYETAGKFAKKLIKSKGKFFGLVQQMRVGKRVNAKTGKISKGFAQLPEELIDEIGAGPEGLAKMKELLALSKEKFNAFIKAWKQDVLGSTMDKMRSEIKVANRKNKAKGMLDGTIPGLSKAQLKELGLTQDQMKNLLDDPEWVISLLKAVKNGKAALNDFLGTTKNWVASMEEVLDPLDKVSESWDKYSSAVDDAFSAANMQTQIDMEDEFASKNGKTTAQMEIQVKQNEKLIQQEQDKIDAKNDLIAAQERLNEKDQQNIDDTRRQDELRNRVSSALSHELEIMSQKETEIRKIYDERVAALDKVAALNDKILQSQKDQLNISQALSSGDIYAATAAAQQMRQNQAQAAQQNVKDALQKGLDNQIAGLRTSEGLTREEAEKQIESIKEQSYQTGLKILETEDKIYARNIVIRDYKNEIYNIEQGVMKTYVDQNKEYSMLLSNYATDLEIKKSGLIVAGLTQDQWVRAKNNYQLYIDSIKGSMSEISKLQTALDTALATYAQLGGASPSTDLTPTNSAGVVLDWNNLSSEQSQSFSNALANSGVDWANLDLSGLNLNTGTFAGGGMIKKYASGGVAGNGSRDSVSAMLTPGEFVIRKSMVDKYGMPMLSAINQGSFSMPKYSMPKPQGMEKIESNNSTNISAPMYNSYNVGVNVSNAGASADEIANITISKIKQMQSTQIRSGRGY